MLTAMSVLAGGLRGPALRAASRRLLSAAATKEEIEKMTKADKVVVFMKGTPTEPRCGFSGAVVKVLELHSVDFSAVDVLSADGVREGVKQYSDWPTIPQIFLDGEFLGGCDILLQMHQSGELVQTLKQHGITSALQQDDPPPSS